MLGLYPQHFHIISRCQDTQRETSVVFKNLLGSIQTKSELYYVRISANTQKVCTEKRDLFKNDLKEGSLHCVVGYSAFAWKMVMLCSCI